MSSWFGGGGGDVGGGSVDPSASGFTADYGTWDGQSAGEAIPIQGSSGNIDAGTFDGSGQGGVDWNKVLKAVGKLSDVNAGQGQGVQNLPGAKSPEVKTASGSPAHAAGLTALLQMLNQRRDMYMQAATTPGANAQQQPPAPGLLGV